MAERISAFFLISLMASDGNSKLWTPWVPFRPWNRTTPLSIVSQPMHSSLGSMLLKCATEKRCGVGTVLGIVGGTLLTSDGRVPGRSRLMLMSGAELLATNDESGVPERGSFFLASDGWVAGS